MREAPSTPFFPVRIEKLGGCFWGMHRAPLPIPF